MKNLFMALGIVTLIAGLVFVNIQCRPVYRFEYKAQNKRITRLERIAYDNGMWPAGEPTPTFEDK